MRAIAAPDDRSPYGRRHSRAYETGRSYRFPGDRRRGWLVGLILWGAGGLLDRVRTLNDVIDEQPFDVHRVEGTLPPAILADNLDKAL